MIIVNYNRHILLPFKYHTTKFRNVCTRHECRGAVRLTMTFTPETCQQTFWEGGYSRLTLCLCTVTLIFITFILSSSNCVEMHWR